MQATERDWSHLDKGDLISRAECESYLGVDHTQAAYGQKMMGLVSHVQAALRDAGKHYHVCTRKGGLYVLTDEETPDFTASALEGARRKINRAHLICQRADRSQMSDEAKRKHDRSLAIGAAYTQALARAKKEST